MQKINNIEKKCGYKFKNRDLLITALTHSSYAHQFGVESNERLEFLGDAVLNFIVSTEIFRKNLHEDEQFLTELKSAYVNRNFLHKIGKKLSLNRGLRQIGLTDPRLDQVLEALIGAIYLDGGFTSVKKFIKKFILTQQISPLRDYKGLLKTTACEKFGIIPEYKVEKIYGPPHRRKFVISVSIKNSGYKASATGRTKKEAELKASMLLLNKISRA